MKFKVGDRVRARDIGQVGITFRGLVGTVVQVDERLSLTYLVDFDTPPQAQAFYESRNPRYQGGRWSDDSLELADVTAEEEEAAIASILGSLQ